MTGRAEAAQHSGRIANKEAVGAGIRASGIPRDDIFLTTKIWHTDLAPGDFRRSVENAAESFALVATTEDCQEALNAFVEKRTPNYRGR